MIPPAPPEEGFSLDPADWSAFRAQARWMLEDALDHVEHVASGPVWRAPPAEVRARFEEGSPRAPTDLAEAHERLLHDLLPYSSGNGHPAFMGWVQGAGTPVGMMGELLAAAINANLGGRDHMAIAVERQIGLWAREWFKFPETSEGLFVTGASMANFMGVLAARARAAGTDVRRQGVAGTPRQLTAYVARTAHGCVARAMDMAGLGSDALRLIETDQRHRINLSQLREAIAADRASGLQPFLVVGTAGTVDVGAVDDLEGLADVALVEDLWFHVDGALAALGVLSPEVAPLLAGIERADSIAFDFHKWGQVPYDAGYFLARDGERLRDAFASPAAYLRRDGRGLAGGDFWPCDYGPDLSRGFRALKTWLTFTTLGTDAIGASIARTCELARMLAREVEARPELELLAPVALNIVCFRHRGGAEADALNAEIVAELHESGRAAPSLTTIGGRIAIRAAIVNHRTGPADILNLVEGVLDTARGLQRRVA